MFSFSSKDSNFADFISLIPFLLKDEWEKWLEKFGVEVIEEDLEESFNNSAMFRVFPDGAKSLLIEKKNNYGKRH